MRGKNLPVPLPEREKKASFWLGLKKKVGTGGKNHSPPHISSGPPLTVIYSPHYGFFYCALLTLTVSIVEAPLNGHSLPDYMAPYKFIIIKNSPLRRQASLFGSLAEAGVCPEPAHAELELCLICWCFRLSLCLCLDLPPVIFCVDPKGYVHTMQ